MTDVLITGYNLYGYTYMMMIIIIVIIIIWTFIIALVSARL